MNDIALITTVSYRIGIELQKGYAEKGEDLILVVRKGGIIFKFKSL